MASTAVSLATKIAAAVWSHCKRHRNTLANLEEEIRKALALHISRATDELDAGFQRDVLYPRIGACIEFLVALRSAGAWRSFFDDGLDRVQVAIDDLIAARRYMENQRLSLSVAPPSLPSPPPPPPPPPQTPPLQINFFMVNLSQRAAN